MTYKIIGFRGRLIGKLFGDLAKQYHLSFLKYHFLTWQLLILAFCGIYANRSLSKAIKKAERSISNQSMGLIRNFVCSEDVVLVGMDVTPQIQSWIFR